MLICTDLHWRCLASSGRDESRSSTRTAAGVVVVVVVVVAVTAPEVFVVTRAFVHNSGSGLTFG